MNRDRDLLLDIVELIETIDRNRPPSETELIDDEVLLTAVVHWVQTTGRRPAASPRTYGTVTQRCGGVRSST